MNDTPKYTKDKLFDFIKHDALVSLYNNPLLKEKSEEISGTYSYLFGGDIKEVKYIAPLLVVNQEKAESIYSQISYDLVQSFGFNFFTNADLKTKELSDVLIHSILCDNESASGKIKALKEMKDTPVLVHFSNLDTATPVVINELKSFIDSKPDNIFMGFEAKSPIQALNLKLLEVDNAPVQKMKIR
jgi:hypothetical protein